MKKMTLVIFVLLAVCMFCGCSEDKGSDKKQNSEIQRKLYAVDVLIPDEADNNLPIFAYEIRLNIENQALDDGRIKFSDDTNEPLETDLLSMEDVDSIMKFVEKCNKEYYIPISGEEHMEVLHYQPYSIYLFYYLYDNDGKCVGNDLLACTLSEQDYGTIIEMCEELSRIAQARMAIKSGSK